MSMHQDNLPPLQDPAFLELMALFHEQTYLQRIKAMFTGLRQAKDSREYKIARLELQRQLAPAAAIVVPCLTILLLAVFASGREEDNRTYEMEIIQTEEMKDLEEIKEPERPIDDIQPTDIEFTPEIAVNTPTPTDAPMSPQPTPFDAVLTVKSPVILRGIVGSSRSAGMRGSLMAAHGGNKATEEAVMRALRWLKKYQKPDGTWGSNASAITSMAILCFLAHGEKPGESVEFGDTVQRGIEALIKLQRADGFFPGNYHQPIATYALCEAYGMTMNPNVKTAAEKAIVHVVRGQHPTGGWNYGMENKPQADGTYRDDTSVMGWCGQALKAAKMAGITCDGFDKAYKLAIAGFKKNYHPNGGFGYTSPGQGGLSGVGTLCLQFLGAGKSPEVEKTLAYLDAWTFDWQNPQGNSPVYYWYYITQAKFHSGGSRWTEWNRKFSAELVRNQKIEPKAIPGPDGELKDIGCWTSPAEKEHNDKATAGTGQAVGNVQDTCLSALQLMVYYRYLPTFKTPAVEEEVIATATDTGDIKVDTNL